MMQTLLSKLSISFQIAKLKGIFLFSSDAATRMYNVIDQSPFEPRHIHNMSYHLINVFTLRCFKQSPHLLNTCFPWRLITSCYIFIKRFFWCKQRLSLFPMRWGASTEIHTVYLCHYITKPLQNQQECLFLVLKSKMTVKHHLIHHEILRDELWMLAKCILSHGISDIGFGTFLKSF